MARMTRKPTVQEFKLKCDPEGKASVVIRQARNVDTEHRGELFATTTTQLQGRQANAVQTHWNIHEQRRIEAGMVVACVTGITIAESEALDAKEVPLFKTKDTPDGLRLDMSLEEFYAAWGQLEDAYVREIHSYILVVNPQWNPNAPGE